MDDDFVELKRIKIMIYMLAAGFIIYGLFSLKSRIRGMTQSGETADSNAVQTQVVSVPVPIPVQKPPAPVVKCVISSPIAGKWYSSDPKQLRDQILGFARAAATKPADDVTALILPHAGYQFSGQAAVAGLKAINRRYERIIVIGPSHYVSMLNTFSVPSETHYSTPLGEVAVDTEFIQKLKRNSIFRDAPQANRQEHSVHIQIPLLQCRQQDFKLVPIVAGNCLPETIETAAGILKSMIDDKTLVIASSDFVHYGPDYNYVPFTENVPEELKKLDMGAYKYIEALDGRGFLQYIERTSATVCGYVPIATVLAMLDKKTTAELVQYATSGGLTGDFTNSVSYLAVVFHKNQPVAAEEKQQGGLSESDKKQLLELARKTLVWYLEKGNEPQISDLGMQPGTAMKDKGAVFVTLKKDSELRGCIGDLVARGPLYGSVMRNAINAGVNDPRFPPVSRSECDKLDIEISSLTEPVPVMTYKLIRIGTDGVILKKAGRSAVFLPQVAPEQGWDVEQMLTHLSLKAGLPPDAWKDGAEFLVFQAVVFSEK